MYLESNKNTIILGDSLDVQKKISDNKVDAIVSDSPFGMGIFNKDWDKKIPEEKNLKESCRVLKPGGFAFFMSSPRQDLLSALIIRLKNAGFDIGFSSIYWTNSAGFSKAKNIPKDIEKKHGRCEESQSLEGTYAGFQPKPAVEVIVVAMKPREKKTYTEQARSNGKGCTHLDNCRIPYEDEEVPSRDLVKQKSTAGGQVPASQGEIWNGNPEGRFPANLLVSDNALDTSNKNGNYSRFFSLDAWANQKLPFLKVPKASKKEKEAGLEQLEAKAVNDGRIKEVDNPFQRGITPRKNTNPCTKPVQLMAYLIALGSRPGDLILDPFAGSGTTCVAAKLLGRDFIGIEREEEYHQIAVARVENASLEVPVLNKAVAEIRASEVIEDTELTEQKSEPCFSDSFSDDLLEIEKAA